MRLALSLLCLLSPAAFAAKPVITNITGASYVQLTGTITAWGGFAGPACTNPNDISLTCDSCALVTAGTLAACNATRAYGSLQFRVYANHTDSGNLLLYASGSNTNLLSVAPFNSSYAAATWDSICNNMGNTGGGGVNCDTLTQSLQGTVRICVDRNFDGDATDSGEECEDVAIRINPMVTGTYDLATATQGISDFRPFPGDEKIYIKDPYTGAGGLQSLPHGGTGLAVRVFISQENMTTAKPGMGLTPKDLTLTTDGGQLDNSIVDGLTNGTRYWFRLAIVDQAQNVGYFWPNDGHTDENGAACDSAPCKYSAIPDEVVGMLTDDVNCFIASAAYGTSFNEKLDTFREFRFRKLLPHAWGQEFVKAYYHYGPFAARYIHDKPALRAAARAALWPAYGFSLLTLQFGWPTAIMITLFAMGALIALPLYGVRRFFPRA